MQSKITFKKIRGAMRIGFAALALFISFGSVMAQTTITTTYPVTSANALVTFNLTNNNTVPIVVTNLASVINLAPGANADVAGYFKTSAINGLPGPISTANGWNQFASNTVTANGLLTPQPFFTSFLMIPAGATYGFAVSAVAAGTTTPAYAYSNAPIPATFTANGVTFTSGANVGYGGGVPPAAPATAMRGFVGSITFQLTTPCAGAPTPGNTITSASSVCPGSNFTLSPQNNPFVTGLTYQWQSSSALAGTYTNIPGATERTLTTSLTSSTYYRVEVTCGANTGTSTPVLVNVGTLTITGQPASTSVACGGTATFTATTNSGALNPTFQWQYRTSPSGVFLNVPNTAPYSGANTAVLTVSPTSISMNGYQYRLVYGSTCTATDFSSTATLAVTPLALTITPTTITKCLSAAPVLISAPSTQNVVSFTNSTPGFIDDGYAFGISRDVAVTGVTGPIQKVRVTLNAASVYIGDLIISLKAPNGQIINLDYMLNRTNNGVANHAGGPGFINTIFNLNRIVRGVPGSSSAVVVPASQAIDQFTDPYTGEFPIDNQQATYYVGYPSGPAGLAATTDNVGTFYTHTPASSANGVWTLGLYDAGNPDSAFFQNYTLEITYGGAPATVSFTPTTGLFTDAAGTTPYTGGQVTQVYANPSATTTYQAVIAAGACTTAPQNIVVNVNSPVGGTTTLNATSVCTNSNATFALGGTLTGGPAFIHNFQVSTNGGATYTNIVNGGIYSGANTNTLTLTNIPFSANGYIFRDSISTVGNCGSMISDTAKLTVNPTPVVTISAAPRVNLLPGLTTTLTAAVSSATAPVTYQWFRNGVLVTGATGNTLNVGIEALGTYTVTVTDANGCSSTAATTTPAFIVIGDSVGVTTLFIYPSPNSGRFQVRYFNDITNGSQSPAFVNVYDEKGARVFTKRYDVGPGYQSMYVDLGTHGKGLYRVELLDLAGNRIKTGSVMVF